MRSIYKACIAAVVALLLGLGAASWASAGDQQTPPGDPPTSEPTEEPSTTSVETPEPSYTHTPKPSYTHTPKPSYTHTPKPSYTHTPKPSYTHTPKPSYTHTPKPSYTHTPKPTPTPTPTPTVPVVPIPALFSAEPTPPTCETAGSFDVEDTFPNVSIVLSPPFSGPGTYTLTVTAENGATFPDGTTSKTRTITIEGALGFQSSNPEAPCYLATPTPTPTPFATPTPTPTPTALNVGVLQPFCDNDVPRLRYEISVTGTTSNTVTITWLNPGGVNVVYANQPLSGSVLWPGAVPGADGRGVDWPGWRQLSDGSWVEGDEFDWVRPTVQVLFQVNPEATVSVSYPPSSPSCLTSPPDQVLATSLSVTGTNAGQLLATSAALALVGAAVLGGLAWLRRRGTDVE